VVGRRTAYLVAGLLAVLLVAGATVTAGIPQRILGLGPVHGPVSALFVGDSFAAGGYPGVSKDQAFPCRTAKDLGWTCDRDAVGATGYQSDGKKFWPTNDTYLGRLDTTRVSYPHPDIIVVSGGRNDDQTLIGTAARNYLLALDQAYPDAKIFVLEPFWMGPAAADVSAGRLAVQAAAHSAGATWVPTQGWLAPNTLSWDLIHPTLAGQDAITQHLTAALRSAT
jgi:hypothetical protein